MWVFTYWSEKHLCYGQVSTSVIVGGVYVRENNGQETVDPEKNVVPKMWKDVHGVYLSMLLLGSTLKSRHVFVQQSILNGNWISLKDKKLGTWITIKKDCTLSTSSILTDITAVAACYKMAFGPLPPWNFAAKYLLGALDLRTPFLRFRGKF